MFDTGVTVSEHPLRRLVNWLSRVGIVPITPDYGKGSSFENVVSKIIVLFI
jgi:hypothetical protein